MMDEGAASLRDRDMIARRRGGPFVHRCSRPSFLFLPLENARLLLSPASSRPAARRRAVARVRRVHQATWPNAPLSPSDLLVLFCNRRTRQKLARIRPRMPMSRLLTRCLVTFRGLRSRKNIAAYATDSATTVRRSRNRRGHFSQPAREVDLASPRFRCLRTFHSETSVCVMIDQREYSLPWLLTESPTSPNSLPTHVYRLFSH